jgi:thioredoxin reductase
MDLMVDGLAPTVKNQKWFYDLVVVGAGPARTSAAICAAGEGIDTLLIEAEQAEGGARSIECIDDCSANPEGITMTGWADLTDRGGRRFLLNVRPGLTVTAIGQEEDHYQVETNQGHRIGANALILAPGLCRRRPNLPGEQEFQGTGVHTCVNCEGPRYAGKDVVVIGTHDSGINQALSLAEFAKRVTVVEQGVRATGTRDLYQKAKTQPNITFKINCIVREFKGSHRLTSVLVEDSKTGAFEELDASAAFMTIGLEPATAAFQNSVDVDQRGFIKTSSSLQTSLAGVFAAGHALTSQIDCAEDAASDGYKAAMLVVKYLDKQRHQ